MHSPSHDSAPVAATPCNVGQTQNTAALSELPYCTVEWGAVDWARNTTVLKRMPGFGIWEGGLFSIPVFLCCLPFSPIICDYMDISRTAHLFLLRLRHSF